MATLVLFSTACLASPGLQWVSFIAISELNLSVLSVFSLSWFPSFQCSIDVVVTSRSMISLLSLSGWLISTNYLNRDASIHIHTYKHTEHEVRWSPIYGFWMSSNTSSYTHTHTHTHTHTFSKTLSRPTCLASSGFETVSFWARTGNASCLHFVTFRRQTLGLK